MSTELQKFVTTALEAQQELGVLLEELLEISMAQPQVLETDGLGQLLDRKQELLNLVESRHPDALFQLTHRIAERLTERGESEMALRLLDAMEMNRHRFLQVARSEQAVQQEVQARVDSLNAILTSVARQRTVRKHYQALPIAVGARFLDGRQ